MPRRGFEIDNEENTYLDLTFLPAGCLKITLSDPFGNEVPKLPALPFSLLPNGQGGHLLLWTLHIVEQNTVRILGRCMPLTLNGMLWCRRARRRDQCFK